MGYYNNTSFPFNEVLSFTFVSVETLQNEFPTGFRRDSLDVNEDHDDNENANRSLNESRKKGTRPWVELKKELKL